MLSDLSGATAEFECEPTDTLAEIKDKIEEKLSTGAPVSKVIHKGKVLEEGREGGQASSSLLPLPAGVVREASALLRLYTALRGVAGMKFTEEEVSLLVSLITRRPPPSPAGVRLVSLGLSMLIACNSLIGQPDLERRATDWIRWLVDGEAYTESQSYGEMLLLTAIHFHAGQLSAVADLVCQTTGIKKIGRASCRERV